MSGMIYSEVTRGWTEADRARFSPGHFTHLTETGSTNDDLLARARAGEALPFELISTDYQSKGRGRRGDRWEAARGRNLLFSLALPLESPRETWACLPQLTAALVGRAIEDILGPGHRLGAKWPNDLLYKEKKPRRHPRRNLPATQTRRHRRCRHQCKSETRRTSRRTPRLRHFALRDRRM